MSQSNFVSLFFYSRFSCRSSADVVNGELSILPELKVLEVFLKIWNYTGIHPVDRQQVLQKLPMKGNVDDIVTKYLKDQRFDKKDKHNMKRKKLM